VTSTCAPSTYTVERRGERAAATLDQPIASCTLCSGTGLTREVQQQGERKYEITAPCARRKLAQRLKLFDEAAVPAVQAHATFESYQPARQTAADAKKVAKDFALSWPDTRGFILAGPVGTGKTHLLSAALRHCTIEKGARAAYIEISLLFATIRRGFQDGKSGGEIIQPLSTVDLLAIDELGKGRGSAFELETLDELIARRYNAGKVTLFATNYSLKAPEDRARRGMLSTDDLLAAGKDSKLLCDRVGDRIYSRLCEMCTFVEFGADVPDYRRAPVRGG
jgi:DNA replication protein DnaC